jgi:hypothetical protein
MILYKEILKELKFVSSVSIGRKVDRQKSTIFFSNELIKTEIEKIPFKHQQLLRNKFNEEYNFTLNITEHC